MKITLASFVIIVHHLLFAQGQWEMKWTIPCDSLTVWDIDQASFSIVCSQNNIIKRDQNGKKICEQSIKSIGAITKIDAANIFKLALFSENQQQICFLDNVLTIQDECVDLSKFDIQFAQTFSYTAQNDRLWVYDQLNSSIKLITHQTVEQQFIQNLRSLLPYSIVSQLVEWENELYLIDDTGKVHHFDLFGSLVGTIELPSAGWTQPWKDGFLVAAGHTITYFDPNLAEATPFFNTSTALTDPILSFKWQAATQLLYVQTKDELTCSQFKK